MPTRKLPDSDLWTAKFKECRHPDHNPPSHSVFEPGMYEHACPKCGQVTTFVVPPKPTLLTGAGLYRFVP